jgi:GNAT superfamily N-acetyltransferase
MALDYRFSTLHAGPIASTTEMKRLTDFLAVQDLGYPAYHAWVQRTEAELVSGWKTAVCAYSEGRLVGNIVWQPHKELPGTREIKNLRVDPLVRDRGFARFMLRQAETEQAEGIDLLIGDVREGQEMLMGTLLQTGYTPIATVNLYEPDKRDVVMVKPLRRDAQTKPALDFVLSRAQ